MRRQDDNQLRRLMEYYFRSYQVDSTRETAERFLGVYDCFMQAVPPSEQDADRLDRLFRAVFGVTGGPREPVGDEATKLSADLQALTARFAREQAQRHEEEALRKQVQEELTKVEGTVASLYGDLLSQLEERQRTLSERETELLRHERETHERLRIVQALEEQLQTRLERDLHHEAHTLLDERIELLSGELSAIREELEEIDEPDAATDIPTEVPLLGVIRRLKVEARTAGIDPLTGLRSRDRLERDLADRLQAFQGVLRAGDRDLENFALLHCHIDDFDGINNRYGRAVGDTALQRVGRVLKTLRRGTDAAYRFGGAEMMVLLPRTPASGAYNVAEILRREIRQIQIPLVQGSPAAITVSVGVCDAVSAGPAILSCAARALCEASEKGGNRTVVYAEPAFVDALPGVIPVEFGERVRHRLLLQDGFSVVALRSTAPGRFAELQARVAEAFQDHSAHKDDLIYLLLESPDAKATLAQVEAHLEDFPVRAAATDVSEAPPASEASPAARAHALLGQLVEMIE
ncbi:MAG: diguanylate cyclase [Nitrospirota bacterium]|jgi:diguanylate cyclase (GGDEF)-like protein